MAMQSQGFPPEERMICDWLIRELADAQGWEQIRTLMRALANVRRLGEVERAQHHPMTGNASAPVPQMPPQMTQPPRPPGFPQPKPRTQAPEPDFGADPWEIDPETA